MPANARVHQGSSAGKLILAGLMTLLCVEASERAPIHPAAASHSIAAAAPTTSPADATGDAASATPPADGPESASHVTQDPALRKTLRTLKKRLAKRPDASAVSASSIVVGGSIADIPGLALQAYRRGSILANVANPGCHIPWSLLAGIGRVESDHGQNGGSRPDAKGVVHPAILGPVLDGGANAAIPDTDSGRFDGNTQWDRAVGPMQFIPSTWEQWGRDGDGDGVADPENLFDAALAAGDYLCASGGDLRTPAAAANAVLSYNHSQDYVLLVLAYSSAYAGQSDAAVTAYLASLPKAKPTPKPKPGGKGKPGAGPSKKPARSPSPSVSPSASPSTSPSPSAGPSKTPSPAPTSRPSRSPSPRPSRSPSPSPPAPSPSVAPSTPPPPPPSPTPTDTTPACATPTPVDSPSPTDVPTPVPSDSPTPSPSCV